MMDEAMRLAEEVCKYDGAGHGEVTVETLARALLALKPLVEAAEAWEDEHAWHRRAVREADISKAVAALRGAR